MFKLALFLSLLAFSSLAQQDACYGLAFQGGGDKGAYEAGAFSVLSAQAGGQYDVVSGVSFGGLNAAFVSQYPKGQEQTASTDLVNFWTNLKASDLYKNWPGGVVQGVLFEPGLYNTAKSKDFLAQFIKQTPQRYVSVGATNVDHASYFLFDNFHGDLDADTLLQGVLATMALPGVFPYVIINDTAYFDGGAIMSVDVGSVIHKCRELVGNDDSKIFIDVVLVTDANYAPKNVSSYNGIQMLIRTLELMSYNSALTGLVQAHSTYPNINWRHLIHPQEKLPDSILPVTFPHDAIVKMIQIGQADAQKEISEETGSAFKKFVEVGRAKMGRKSYQQEKEILMEAFAKELENIKVESERNPEYGMEFVNV